MTTELFAAKAAPKTYERTPAPTSSPWGTVDGRDEIAPGIWKVSTPGHGGLKLSRQRQAAMPSYLRCDGGWYEEDCEWALVALGHPDAFNHLRPWQIEQGIDETDYDAALRTAKNWYPVQYERHFGVTIPVSESYTKSRMQFAADNAENFVVVAAWGDWAKFVPKGKVGVVARKGGHDGKVGAQEKWFLIDAAEYRSPPNKHGFVIDQARHHEIAEPKQEDRV